MKLSASQIKTYCSSPAKWAGKYILGIKDEEYAQDSLALGTMVEYRIMNGKDDMSILHEYKNIEDMEKLLELYEVAKYNATGLEMELGTPQMKVEGELLGCSFVGYLDNLVDGVIRDIKTCQYPTNKETTAKNFWSGMSYIEEYELQLWIYMKLTGLTKSRIAEVSKHQYEDGRNANQIIEIDMTEEFDKRMTEKYEPIIKEMVSLKNKYSYIKN